MSETQKDGFAAGFNVQDFEAFKARKEAGKNGAGQGLGLGFHPDMWQSEQPGSAPGLGFGPGSVLSRMQANKQPAPGLGFHPEKLQAEQQSSAPGLGFRPEASDTVDAALTPGEYVLPKDTVEQVGVDNLDALLEATKTPGRGFSGKEGNKFYFAGGSLGGVPDDENKLKQTTATPMGSGFNRTFNAATDSTDNVIKARQESNRGTQDINAPWYSPSYARAANASEKSGLELERDRRAAGVAANLPSNDPMQTLLKTGATRPSIGATAPAAASVANPTDPVQQPGAPADDPRAAHQRVLAGEQRVADQGALNAARTANQPQGIGLDNMTAGQRNSTADAYRNHVDSATGTGPGAAASGPGLGFGTMQKRIDAYAADPSLLAARNAREDLLGSGIRMGVDGKGQLNISNQGAPGLGFSAESAKPSAPTSAPGLGFGPGSVLSSMQANQQPAPGLGFGEGSVLSRMQQDPLASYERANAARQSMIDSQRGGVHILGGGGGMDADRQALLRKTMTAHPGAQNGQLTAAQLNAARGIMNDAQGESIKQTEINQRAAEAAQRGMIDQARVGIDAQRAGTDRQRLSMDQVEHAGRMEDAGFARQARQGLIDTAGSEDAAAKNAARARAVAAGVLKPEAQQSVRDRYLTLTQTDRDGNKTQVAVDPVSGRTVRATEPTGHERAVGTTSRVGDKVAVWDGEKWVERS